jgi:hypothetical protein
MMMWIGQASYQSACPILIFGVQRILSCHWALMQRSISLTYPWTRRPPVMKLYQGRMPLCSANDEMP